MAASGSISARDDAVSPVVGATLMIAISIILAAVIAVIVMGGGNGLLETSPQATFQFTYADNGTADATLNESDAAVWLTITHAGGDRIKSSELRIRASPGGTVSGRKLGLSSNVTAGASTTVRVDTDSTVRIIHSRDRSQSTILAQWNGPAA